jgi:Na+-driven multidrug efflux pump
MAELIGVAIWLFAPACISLFTDSAEVIALGTGQSRTEALFYCLLAFSHCIAGICRGAGKANIPMLIMLACWCVIRIIYISIAVHFIGEIGVIYWAYPLTWGLSSIVFLIYYLCSDWVHAFERKSLSATQNEQV